MHIYLQFNIVINLLRNVGKSVNFSLRFVGDSRFVINLIRDKQHILDFVTYKGRVAHDVLWSTITRLFRE